MKLDYIGPARTSSELRAAFVLCQRLYERDGLAQPNALGMRWTVAELERSSLVAVAVYRGEVVGTGAVVTSRFELPSAEVCRDILEVMDRAGHITAEATSLACEGVWWIRPNVLTPPGKYRMRPIEVAELLVPLGVEFARAQGCTTLVVTVHPRHEPFWWGQGFRSLSTARACPHVNGQQGMLMGRELRKRRTGRVEQERSTGDGELW